jgi:putative acetyltransferase
MSALSKNESMIEIRTADPALPDALALLTAGHAAMCSLFPEKRNMKFSVDALLYDHVTLVLAYHNDVPVGCCAVSIQTDYSELKRLFVTPEARRLGVAMLLIEYVEDFACAQRSKKVMLESGVSLSAAHKLYLRAGYIQCKAFGSHEDLPKSLFFEKALAN